MILSVPVGALMQVLQNLGGRNWLFGTTALKQNFTDTALGMTVQFL
jgi:hypothetical protein